MKSHRFNLSVLPIMLALMVFAAPGHAVPPTVHEDILQALRLEGRHCDAIDEVEHRAVADYIVNCSNGKRYQIEATPDGRMQVTDPDEPQTDKAQQVPDRPRFLRQTLTAVIHLADASCGAVLAVTTLNLREHLATCSNKKRYRVYTSAAGTVQVDEQ